MVVGGIRGGEHLELRATQTGLKQDAEIRFGDVVLTKIHERTGKVAIGASKSSEPWSALEVDPAKYGARGGLLLRSTSSAQDNPPAGEAYLVNQGGVLYLRFSNGKTFRLSDGFAELEKITDPAASPVGTGRLYLRDNGSGKMQVVARFPTGAVQVIVTEP